MEIPQRATQLGYTSEQLSLDAAEVDLQRDSKDFLTRIASVFESLCWDGNHEVTCVAIADLLAMLDRSSKDSRSERVLVELIEKLQASMVDKEQFGHLIELVQLRLAQPDDENASLVAEDVRGVDARKADIIENQKLGARKSPVFIPDAMPATSKGMCAICKTLVLSSHKRVKCGTLYIHKGCYENSQQ